MKTARLIIVLLILLPGVAFAAVETTTVNGQVIMPSSAVATAGTITAALSSPGTALDGAVATVVGGLVTASIDPNGRPVNLVLVPNDAITPAGTYYQVTFSVTAPTRASWSRMWMVTTSPDPVNIGAITVLNAPPAIRSTLDSISDVIAPTPADQDCLRYDLPSLAWKNYAAASANCATGGGGGGTPAFDAITNGTSTNKTFVMGNGSNLTATGSGTIVASGVKTDAVSGVGISVAGESIGELMYFGGTDWVHLINGTAGTVLSSGGIGGIPTWGQKPDQVTVQGNATQDSDFNDTIPAAPGGSLNVVFQSSGSNPTNISAYVPGGGAPSFDLIRAGTNTTAAMVVGNGSTLASSGSTGSIEANKIRTYSGSCSANKVGAQSAGAWLRGCDPSNAQKYAANGNSAGGALEADHATIADFATIADAAAALDHDPTDCAGGNFATAIDAGGNLTCGTPGSGTYLPLAGGTMTGTLATHNVGDVVTLPTWQTNQNAPAVTFTSSGYENAPWRQFVQNGFGAGASLGYDHVLITAYNLKINQNGTYARDNNSSHVVQWNSESRYTFAGDPLSVRGLYEWNLNIDPTVGVGTVNTVRPWEFQYDMDGRKTLLNMGIPSDPNSGFFQMSTGMSFWANTDIIRFADRSIAGSNTTDSTTQGRLILDPGARSDINGEYAPILRTAGDGALMVEAGKYAGSPSRMHFGYFKTNDIYFGQSAAIGGHAGVTVWFSDYGIKFMASDSNPGCGGTEYGEFADLSEARLKVCQAGTVTPLQPDAGRSLTRSGDHYDADAELYTQTKCLNVDPNSTITDFLFFRPDSSVVITGIDCIVDSANNLPLTLKECDGNAGSCTNVEATITCAQTNTTESAGIDAPAIEAGNYLRVVMGAKSGTPTQGMMCVTFTAND